MVPMRVEAITMERMRRATLLAAILCAGCQRSDIDTSTPDAVIDSAIAMVRTQQTQHLPDLIEIPAREITFEDGVTETSAIAEVKAKAGQMLARLLRVAEVLREKFPREVAREMRAALNKRDPSTRQIAVAIMADPAEWLTAQRQQLTTADLGDGTASLQFDGEPVFAGALSLVQTDAGWRLRIPVEMLRDSPYWPDTRDEWSVIASMMLSVEHALMDFQRDLDSGSIANLDAASARVGRVVGESIAVQSIIYAAMKRPDAVDPAAPAK